MPRSVAMWPWAGVSVRAWLSASALLLATATGQVGAQVGVGPSGSPGFSQAIKLPPGIAGMTPNLGLSFGGGGVNGPLGYGWSLQGLSMISRCAGIAATDGAPKAVLYKPSDKLCLDGQRLIQTDAGGRPIAATASANGALNDAQGLVEPAFTEYRTEKDSYARIRAYGAAGGDVNNGPAYFRVWTKSGQVYDYGATPTGNTRGNALVRAKNAGGIDSVAVAWAANRISDTLGNYIDFFYAQRDVAWGSGPTAGAPRSGHEWGLMEVQYTGTATQAPKNKLVLEYEERPSTPGAGSGHDRSEAYHQGSKNVSIWRLKALRSYINWDGATLAFNSDGTVLTPPGSAVKVNTVKLGYTKGAATSRSLLTTLTECAGKDELLCQQPTQFSYSAPVNNEAYTFSTSGTGFETLVMRDLEGKRGVINADFYGEGRQSLIRWSDTPSENQLWRSNGDGTFSQDNAFNLTGENLYKSDSCYYTQVMDMNSDGLPDLLRYSNPKSLDNKACATSGPVLVFINNGNGTFTSKPWTGPALERITSLPIRECPGDLNALKSAVGSAPSPTTATTSTSGGSSNQTTCGVKSIVGYTEGANFFLFDVDGDGLPDILSTHRQEYRLGESEPCPNSGCTRYWHANPNGTYDERATNLRDVAIYVDPVASSGFGEAKKLVDVDGDGLVDIVGLTTTKFGTAAAYRNSGDGNFTPIASPTSCNLPGDFNGDGRSDCLAKAVDALPWNNTLSIALGGGAFEKTANFNLAGIGNDLGGGPDVYPVPYGALIADFNGDGRSDVLRWAADASKNTLYLSNGDGTFRTSTTFNFTGITLKDTTEGKVDFLLGDFTGHGNVEILRMVANPYSPSGGDDPCGVLPLGRTTSDSKLGLQPTPCDQAMSTTVSGAGTEPVNAVSGASFNQLFLRQDQRPADLLLTVTTPTGLKSRLKYTSVSNPKEGMDSDGQVTELARPLYVTARVPGQTSYPKADVAFPMSIVAELSSDTGVGGSAVTTYYTYRGLRVAVNGRGMLGFMQVSQQNTAADGSALTVQTQYLQDHPYIGVASVSQTFNGPIGVSALRLSRSTNGYCEASGNAVDAQVSTGGVAPAPCLTTALVQRPYLAQSLEEGWDLSGDALPTVKKTSTYNGDGDPLTIKIDTTGVSAGQSQTFTKLVSNTYDPADTSCGADNKTCNWTLGRLKRATATNTVPNLLGLITASAGSNANATAIAGTLVLPGSATADLTASLSFNNVSLNTLSTLKATLTNNGTAPLTVSAIGAGSVTGTGFSFQSTDCVASLAAKASCTVTVGFQPTVAGPASGALSITTALGLRTSSLSGTTAGTPTSTLTLSPTSINLADTTVNQTRDSSTITLTNGTVAVSGLTFTPPTGYAVTNTTCGTSLAPSGSCTFALKFQPTAAQAYNGNLSVTATGGASATLAVTGKGIAAAASISASPTSLTLADTVINQTSTSSTVTLTNGSVGISGLTITPPAGYTLRNSTCVATLAPSGTCSFSLSFNPTAVQSYNGNVSISASGGASATVSVTGKGINGSGAVVLDHISPASSGTVIPAYSTTTIAVYYKNQGTGAAVLNNVSTTAGSPYFNSDGGYGSCAKGLSLAPGAKCWLLQGWGGGPGAVSATLSATFDSTIINTPLSAVQKTLDVTASNGGGSTATTLDQVLTITNNTPGAFQFGSPRIRFGTVIGSGSWAVVADSCPAVLNPSSSCTITARYTAGAAGNASVTASVYGQFEWADLLDGYSQRSGSFRNPADVQSTSLSATSLSPVVLDHVSPAASGWVIPAYSTTTLGLYYYNRSSKPVTLTSIATTSGTNFWNSNGSMGSCVPGAALAAGAKCWILQGWGGAAGTVSANVTAVFGATTIVTPVSAVQKTLDLSASNLGGSTSTTLDQVLTISNQTPAAFQFGSPRIHFGSVSGSGSWAVVSDACPAVLNPGSSCTITARYTAGAAGNGSVSAAVYGQFEWADLLDGYPQRSGSYRGIEDVRATTLSATSLPQPATLSVAPASLSFADTQTNQTRDSATVTLTNGASPVSGLSITPPAGFSIINSTCGSSLAAGATCSFAVRFAPTAVQTYSGSVSISANAGAATASVSLSGKGLGAPRLEALTASPFSAGTTLTPYAASGGHVTFKNTGTANVTISSAPTMNNGGVAYTTNGDSAWCGAGVVLAPGATCLVYVFWSSAPGTYEGTLTVPSNGGSPSVVVKASYQGALVFSAVDFGNVTVNTTVDRVVTVTNTAAFPARSINVNGLSAPFSVVGNTCGSTIAAGGTCQVTVRFAPTAATGANTTLRIDGMYNQVYNQTYESAQAGSVMPYSASLAGTGKSLAAPLSLALSPTYVMNRVPGTSLSTAPVTATPTGGVAPYTYLWTVQNVLSGSGSVTAGSTSATATLGVSPPAVCDIGTVNFLATVTDSVGAKASVPIQMTVESTGTIKLGCTQSPQPADTPTGNPPPPDASATPAKEGGK